MNEFEVSVVINRPMPEVWEYVNTTENELVWQSSAVERIPLYEGPIEKGSQIRQVDSFLGRRWEWEWEVTELHDYVRHDRTLTGPLEMEVEWRLDPAGDAARFTVHLATEVGAGNFFGKLADPLLIRIAKRDFQTNLENLKDVLEAGKA